MEIVSKFLEKYRSRILLLWAFVFLIHGEKLHSETIGIDTEDLIHIQGDFYGGWLNTGRQGLVALKWLTASLKYRPYVAGLFTLVLFGLAVSAFFVLWDKQCGKKREQTWLSWITGSLLVIAHPVITEQFYFTLQSAEICIGMLLTALALFLVNSYDGKKHWWKLACAVLILLLTFSVYQSFVVLFIFGTVTILLLQAIREISDGEKTTAGRLLQKIIPFLVTFLAAFCLNQLVTKLFFGSSDYLSGQVLWGKFKITDNFRAIVGHMVKALTGYDSIYYHFVFGVLCILTTVLVVILCRRDAKGKKGVAAVLLFYLAALFLTPFLMTIVCGGTPAARAQLVLPFATGFLAYLDGVLLVEWKCAKQTEAEQTQEELSRETRSQGEKLLPREALQVAKPQNRLAGVTVTKVATVCMAVICAVGIFGELQTTLSLYYTEEMRFEQDAYLGRELIQEIEKVTAETGETSLPVAVIGKREFSGNNACIRGEIMGKSIFDHDTEVEPQYYWSTRRVLGFLHILGADYPQVSKEEFTAVAEQSADMPCFPADGSVQVRDGKIVIKLSGNE